MKPLNFTSTEILQSLLKFFETKGKEGKNQTIRKAWSNIPVDSPLCDFHLHNPDQNGVMNCEECNKQEFVIESKPCPYKVGKIYPAVWHEESLDDSEFCGICGYIVSLVNKAPHILAHNPNGLFFNKHLGKVRITEVFKIKMWVDKSASGFIDSLNMIGTKENMEKIAKRDGFNSTDEMFNYLDKAYDLSQPREFWVIRYEWVE